MYDCMFEEGLSLLLMYLYSYQIELECHVISNDILEFGLCSKLRNVLPVNGLVQFF